MENSFGIRVSAEVLERIATAFDTIAAHPAIGRVREDITSDRRVRFLPVGPSLIAFRQGEEGDVEVLFVERAERDWGALVEDED